MTPVLLTVYHSPFPAEKMREYPSCAETEIFAKLHVINSLPSVEDGNFEPNLILQLKKTLTQN